ncbi:MAG: hypothetical protein KJ798_11840 [Gammaproteobacteria bacterium]|uniref:hypothetical protein n=1 Tax=Limnobacter sp. TaxID=2003368 RepID=UPI001D8F8BF5|nr:hypothetical protein [Limnobacter sp.]MBU0783693.1 hypothetical protein [Gammaproteobacteria bacterium]MBU0848677.1 hypothetical protein [Gammaproteobacteria bacterium]MBU1266605.1 hypothetical protein [Gammaproteobacteria bacterium]MBU1529181.1 hypothetical protein [Gammaproteobacteria bacterium]MBU1781059.1 hypothetical protein [Gammaproteobacteria bacterium]
MNKLGLMCALLLMLGASSSVASAEVVLVAASNNPIDELDARQVQSLYKGRLTSVNGKQLTPLNAAPGSLERNEFLTSMMKLNELDYTGYWHVRRYSGQGTPPKEVENTAELFTILKQQPDGIGYLWIPSGTKPKLPEGLKIIKIK